jgi:nucleoside-diphosphate-sugar epimerase
MTTKYFLTGATGFIGKRLAAQLVAAGNLVRLLSASLPGRVTWQKWEYLFIRAM